MRFANPNTALFLALFAGMLPGAGPGTARSQPADPQRPRIDAVAKQRVFYLPPDAEEVTDKREHCGRSIQVRHARPPWFVQT